MEEVNYGFSQNKYDEGVISYLDLLHKKEALLSTKKLEIMASLAGYDSITQNVITKIELGIRFVPDYEVAIFAELLETTPEYLLGFIVNKE